MSRYGPPGGSGPPGYDPPSDPWGDVSPWEQQPFTMPAGHGPEPPQQGAGYWSAAPAPPEPPRRHPALLIALALVVLVAAGGLATTVYLVSGDDRPGDGRSPTQPAGQGAAGTAPPDPSADTLGLAAGFAVVGDCLINDGTDDDPQMRITRCDAEEEGTVYRVLARFDEAVSDDDGARRVCGSTDGYEFHYYFISDGRGPSFVLCMSSL